MKCLVCNKEKASYYFNVKRNILNKEIVFRICDDCGQDTNIEDDSAVNELLDKEPKIVYHSVNGKRNFGQYGITQEDYSRMFEEQKGRCLICNTHQIYLKIPLAVDHCHISGKVRGLLCHNCNLGLGNFRDNKESLEKAILYLKKAES